MPERVSQLQKHLTISQAQLDRMNALCGSNPNANETACKLCTLLHSEERISGILCVDHMVQIIAIADI